MNCSSATDGDLVAPLHQCGCVPSTNVLVAEHCDLHPSPFAQRLIVLRFWALRPSRIMARQAKPGMIFAVGKRRGVRL